MNNIDVIKIRKNLNLSQEDFGKKVGVTRRTVANWESGGTIPEHQQRLLEMISQNIEIDKSETLTEKDVIMMPKSMMLDLLLSQQRLLENQHKDFVEREKETTKILKSMAESIADLAELKKTSSQVAPRECDAGCAAAG